MMSLHRHRQLVTGQKGIRGSYRLSNVAEYPKHDCGQDRVGVLLKEPQIQIRSMCVVERGNTASEVHRRQ
jgi:hypothetical protein